MGFPTPLQLPWCSGEEPCPAGTEVLTLSIPMTTAGTRISCPLPGAEAAVALCLS